MRDKILLQIADTDLISKSRNGWILLLSDSLSDRFLPVVIGEFEAKAIISYHNDMKFNRPLPYQLFRELTDYVGIQVNEVSIESFKEGIFYSKIVCECDGKTFELDSRTSDAVAIASLFNCPIYTYEHVMSEAGISKSEIEMAEADKDDPDLDEFIIPDDDEEADDEQDIDKLQHQLDEAVENENYDEASRLRDIINELKSKKL